MTLPRPDPTRRAADEATNQRKFKTGNCCSTLLPSFKGRHGSQVSTFWWTKTQAEHNVFVK
jgi:hypothetical protein